MKTMDSPTPDHKHEKASHPQGNATNQIQGSGIKKVNIWDLCIDNLAKYKDYTVSDVCSTDWPKKDSANFESQNFEGP